MNLSNGTVVLQTKLSITISENTHMDLRVFLCKSGGFIAITVSNSSDLTHQQCLLGSLENPVEIAEPGENILEN